MKPFSIAVVGSGIAGLSAAWLLSKGHQVTLFEAANYLGGHSNTIDIETRSGMVPVDTGFIVYNPSNYPNLNALFDHLGVTTKSSHMTFSFSADGGQYEYSGTRLGGLFGQMSNVASPAHWRMLSELARFFRNAQSDAQRLADDVTLADYLADGGYSQHFVNNHLLPMAAAIWSSRASDLEGYPAKAFITFFSNHGLLQATRRPQWRTVDQGSRSYVARMMAEGNFVARQALPVATICRRPYCVEIVMADGHRQTFDHVVLACHADQALNLLNDATAAERTTLGAFNYSSNLAVVHTDDNAMPRRRRLWSSWNYIKQTGETGKPTVTYWMNSLQSLACDENIFVSLNPGQEPSSEIARFNYTHPQFDANALRAQRDLWRLQGERRTWFCGSYFGSGFHEDALQSGLAVAEELGNVRRPWQVDNESGRIQLPAQKQAQLMAAE
jgi:predicted NAD/FAD-binding protein